MSHDDRLAAFLDAARLAVDKALDEYLPRPPACPRIISDAMRYSLFAGGKRLRPVLTLAAADAVARRTDVLRHNLGDVRHDTGDVAQRFVRLALPAACAIEMIHTYSLIHDDLPAMDNDTLRRGRPTLHVLHGDGIAILAGDGLQAAAFTLLAREPMTSDEAIAARKLRVAAAIGEAAGPIGMVGGQAIDLQAEGRHDTAPKTLDAASLREMHARKTGALIRAAAVSGAIMAGADSPALDAIDQYAADVGLAFQIVDDILDVEGDGAALGKTAGKDAAAHKPTYPALFGIDRSRALAAESLDRAGQVLTEAGLTEGHLLAIAEWVVNRKS